MNEVFQGLLQNMSWFSLMTSWYTFLLGHYIYNLEMILKLLLQHRLYARLSKWSIGLQQIDYLGHTFCGQGVAMDKEKVKVLLDWRVPANLKQLKGFLGLTGTIEDLLRVMQI